jgi:hypothetical protein
MRANDAERKPILTLGASGLRRERSSINCQQLALPTEAVWKRYSLLGAGYARLIVDVAEFHFAHDAVNIVE